MDPAWFRDRAQICRWVATRIEPRPEAIALWKLGDELETLASALLAAQGDEAGPTPITQLKTISI